MKIAVAAALLALAFTTGFTCSKNNPAEPPAQTEAAPPQEQMAPPTEGTTPTEGAPTEGAPAEGGETK